MFSKYIEFNWKLFVVAKTLHQDVPTSRHPMITNAEHPPNTLNCIFSPSQFFLVAEMFSPSCFDASQGYSCAVKSPFQPQNRSDQLNTGKIFLNHIRPHLQIPGSKTARWRRCYILQAWNWFLYLQCYRSLSLSCVVSRFRTQGHCSCKYVFGFSI